MKAPREPARVQAEAEHRHKRTDHTEFNCTDKCYLRHLETKGQGVKMKDGEREEEVWWKIGMWEIRDTRWRWVESRSDDAGGGDITTMSPGFSHGQTPSKNTSPRPSGATNHWKHLETVFGDFPTFSRTCIFFLLTFSSDFLLWLFSSLLFICPYSRKFDF